MNEEKTIGNEITERVRNGFELYKYFKSNIALSDKAVKLALADYAVEKYISEEVYRKLKEKIEKVERLNKKMGGKQCNL